MKSASSAAEKNARNTPEPGPESNDVPEPTLPFRACTLVPAFDAAPSLRAVVEELRDVYIDDFGHRSRPTGPALA